MSGNGVAPLIGAVGAMSIGAAAYYYTSSTSKGYHKIQPLVDLHDQTLELSVSKKSIVKYSKVKHTSEILPLAINKSYFPFWNQIFVFLSAKSATEP